MKTLGHLQGIRQGDILLIPVNAVPESAHFVKRQPGEGIIVAAGEMTGHHHRIRTRGAKMYRMGRAGNAWVCAPKGAVLTHEEHAPLTVPPGNYRVVHQQEYVERARAQRVYD
jgi:hypothetical protein